MAGMTSSNRSRSNDRERRRGGERVLAGLEAVVLLRPAVREDRRSSARSCRRRSGCRTARPAWRSAATPSRRRRCRAAGRATGILRVRRVAGRRVDVHLAPRADRLRVVLDHLELAVRDALAPLEQRRRRLRGRPARRRAAGRRAATCAPGPPARRPGEAVRPRPAAPAVRRRRCRGGAAGCAGAGAWAAAAADHETAPHSAATISPFVIVDVLMS